MNERIKELAEQAQDWADAHAPYASEEHEYFVEKFAQLIVRECSNIAKHHVMNISTYADADFVEKQIQEHFGVEE